MQAKVLASYEAPPSNGQWQAVAVIDVELLVNLIPVIIRGITVRSKPQEGKTFFGMRSMKKGEEWAQVVDFPEHGKEVQAALLEAWTAHQKSPSQPAQPEPSRHLEGAHHAPPATQKYAPPKPNYAILEECPF